MNIVVMTSIISIVSVVILAFLAYKVDKSADRRDSLRDR
jgi:hypothetical protein